MHTKPDGDVCITRLDLTIGILVVQGPEIRLPGKLTQSLSVLKSRYSPDKKMNLQIKARKRFDFVNMYRTEYNVWMSDPVKQMSDVVLSGQSRYFTSFCTQQETLYYDLF